MRDPKVEQFLDADNYDWEYQDDIPFDRITLDYNPARWIVGVDEDRVVSMGCTLEAKGKLPAIVVAITATSQYALLSGRHRIESGKLFGLKGLPAYVVTTVLDNFELAFMPYSLNNIEGRSPSYDSKLAQAVHFVTHNPDRKITEIARRLGLKPIEIEQAIKLEKATDRADRLAVLADFRKLVPEIRIVANEALKLDAVFVNAVKCIAFIGKSARDARALIKALADAASEAEALEMVRKEAADHEELLKRLKRRGRKKSVKTPDQIWFYAARRTSKVWPEHPDPKGWSHDDLLEVREVVKDLRGQCNEYLDKIAEAITIWEKAEKSRTQQPGGTLSPDPGC